MRRGITPVVAIVLLLMMTVAASGGAYAWMQNVQEEARDRAQSDLTANLAAKEVICDRGAVRLAVKNSGDRQVLTGEADLYVTDPDGGVVATRDLDLSDWDLSPAGFNRSAFFLPDVLSEGNAYDIELSFPRSDVSLETSCVADVGALAVGVWTFDGTVDDASGHGNDGTVSTTAYVSGKFGQAHDRNAGSNIPVTDSSSLDRAFGGDEITMSIWVKPFSSSDWQDIIEKNNDRIEFGGNSGDATDDLWATVYNPSGGKVCGGNMYATEVMTVGAWNQVMYTYSAESGNERLRVNGTVVDSASGCTDSIRTSTADLRLARHAQDYVLDEVQLYPIELR